jgi:hypothetical protein
VVEVGFTVAVDVDAGAVVVVCVGAVVVVFVGVVAGAVVVVDSLEHPLMSNPLTIIIVMRIYNTFFTANSYLL